MVAMLPLAGHAGPAHAAGSTAGSAATPHIFRAFGSSGAPTGAGSGGTIRSSTSCASRCDGQNLQYGGGFVMHTEKSYAIFWLPTGYHFEGTSTSGTSAGDTNFENLMERYFNDVGGSGLYNLLTQYSTSGGTSVVNGPILNSSTLGGAWVDTRAYQHSNGSTQDGSGNKVGSYANPLFDSYSSGASGDIAAEVSHAMSSNGWTAGRNTEFFVFTAYGVLSCSDDQKSSCSLGENSQDSTNGDYCAYHTAFGTYSSPTIYANMPDGYSLSQLSTSGGYSCGNLHPNGDYYADNEISITSHEQFESITDPWPTSGWFDSNDFSGGEIGDKCAYIYTGTNPQTTPDVTLNGHGYSVQDEWSNATNDCELSLANSASKLDVEAVDANTGAPLSAATAGDPVAITTLAEDSSGNPVAFNGTLHFTSTDAQATLPADTGYIYDGSGTPSSNPATLATSGSQTVTVTATDSSNHVLTGSATISVSPAPATKLVLSGGTQGYAFTGQPFALTVTAQDPYGNTDTNYAGTVHFASSDSNATLPADYTFSGSDTGTHTFNGVTMGSTGSQSVTASDAGNSLSGTLNLTVSAMVPPSAPTGFSATRGNGTISLSWNQPANLGGDSASNVTYQVSVTHEDGSAAPEAVPGTVACAGGITSCAETVSGLANTTGYSVAVTASNSKGAGDAASQNLDPLPASQLVVVAPAKAQAMSPAAVTVTAEDRFGDATPYYAGTIHFTSTDASATLPGDYTFTGADAGTHSFNVTFSTAGTPRVTVSDAASNLAGTSGTVTVSAAPAAPHVAVASPRDGGLALAWSPSTTAGVTGYAINWTGQDGSSGSQTVGGTSTTITGLSNGVSYSFSIVSVNTLGSGPATTVTASPTALSAQYSDPLSAQVAMGTADGKVGTLSETGTLPSGLHFVNHSNNTATLSGTVTGGPKTYAITIRATEGTVSASAPASITIAPEDAFLSYSGDTLAPSNGHVNLRATFWDSAAAGYPGANPDGTLGSVTYAAVYFDMYTNAACSGTPVTSIRGSLRAAKIAGMASITASYTLPAGTTALCTVVHTPVTSTTPIYYQAPATAPQPITVYSPATHASTATAGTAVADGTGTGALTDSVSSKGTYLPSGKLIYSYPTVYNGQNATVTVTSTAVTAFTVAAGVATVDGRASIKVTPVGSTTTLLYDTYATYRATLLDGGPAGAGDAVSLLVYDGNGLAFHQLTAVPLTVGDIANS